MDWQRNMITEFYGQLIEDEDDPAGSYLRRYQYLYLEIAKKTASRKSLPVWVCTTCLPTARSTARCMSWRLTATTRASSIAAPRSRWTRRPACSRAGASGRRLSRQAGRRGAPEESGRLPLRPRSDHGGDQRLRHGHRQAQRPVRHPLQYAQGSGELLSGGGPRGPRRSAVRCILLYSGTDVRTIRFFIDKEMEADNGLPAGAKPRPPARRKSGSSI